MIATVISGEVILQVPVKAKKAQADAGTLVHETAHFFYEAQPIEFQKQILNWINPEKNINSKFLYEILDEVLATITGNGYADKIINEQLSNGNWYNNIEYNTMSKALYDTTEKYLNENKSLDEAYIKNAIKVYEEKFPNAASAYPRALKKLFIVFDHEVFQKKQISTPLKRKFRSNSIQSEEFNHVSAIKEEIARGSPKDYPEEKYNSILLVTQPKRRAAFVKDLPLPKDIIEQIRHLPEEVGFISFRNLTGLQIVYVQANSEEDLDAVFQGLRDSVSIPEIPKFLRPK